MTKEVDVLAVFDNAAMYPRPLRFRVIEQGLKKTVCITNIQNVEWLGAGGRTRVAFDCFTIVNGKRINYVLNYYYNTLKWDVTYK